MTRIHDSIAKLRSLLGLSAEARRFVARAWLAAPAVEVSLKLVGVRRTIAWMDAVPSGRRRDSAVSVELGTELIGRVYRAHFVGGECLTRSLVQYLLHRRDGAAAKLMLGVRRPGGTGLEAHAWVESPSGAAPTSAGGFAQIFAAEMGLRSPS
jgi:hypothetical protein